MQEKRGYPSLTSLYLKMDNLSKELDRIGENGRKHNDILHDIRKRHLKRKWAQEAIDSNKIVDRGPLVVILATLAIITFVSLTGPSITGYITAITPEQSASEFVYQRVFHTPITGAFTFITIALATVGLASMFFGRVEKKHKTRHDKYKHPLMK